jgi:hypothetical protein
VKNNGKNTTTVELSSFNKNSIHKYRKKIESQKKTKKKKKKT